MALVINRDVFHEYLDRVLDSVVQFQSRMAEEIKDHQHDAQMAGTNDDKHLAVHMLIGVQQLFVNHTSRVAQADQLFLTGMFTSDDPDNEVSQFGDTIPPEWGAPSEQ